MKIRYFINVFFIAIVLCLSMLGILVYQMLNSSNDVAIAYRHQYRALQLAQELFQSSEDLTRMARIL